MRKSLIAVAVIALSGGYAASAQAVALNVYGTSDITDSNLLSNVIVPGFASFDPSDSITYTAVGSGAAITAAENSSNHIDAIIVHSPSLEKPFYTNACGGSTCSTETLGRAIFYNDYVVVGPTADPAGIGTAHHGNDAVSAFQDIATEGTANSDVTFISRADNSGTNVEEQQIWGKTTGVQLQKAFNAPASDTTRKEPCFDTPTVCASAGVHAYPSWYKHNTTSSPPNQGVNLVDTNTCNATAYPDHNCYTIVDRGTYDYQTSLSHTGNLKIVVQNNSSGAVGGASLLTNPFHAYIVKTSTNQTAATKLLNYLTGSGFQGSLPTGGAGANDFKADAYATLSGSTLPNTAAKGTVMFSVTLLYPPPVAAPIDGMPVNLQSASSSSGPWTTIASTTSSSLGVVTFSPSLTVNPTFYRLDMSTYDDTLLASQFSPNDNAKNLNTAIPNGKVVCTGC
jgi:ABC-type tungstate transport system permease subunit